MKHLLLAAGAWTATLAHAHPGHGMPGSTHWHATDAGGWVAGLVAVAAALWWSRRR